MQVWVVMVNRWQGERSESSEGRDQVYSVWNSESGAHEDYVRASRNEADSRSWDSPTFNVVGPFAVQV